MLQDSPAEQALIRAELQAVLDQYNYTNIANTSCDAVLFLPNLTLQCAFVKVSEDCKDQVSQLFRRCAIQMNVTSLWFAYRVTILWYDRLICLSTLRFCIALAIRVSITSNHGTDCIVAIVLFISSRWCGFVYISRYLLSGLCIVDPPSTALHLLVGLNGRQFLRATDGVSQ